MSASRWRRWRRWTLRRPRKRSALIHVDYEELPTVAGIEAAIKPGAPLVHEDKSSNIGTHEKVNRGDADEGFAQSDDDRRGHISLSRWSITMRWSRTRRSRTMMSTTRSPSGRAAQHPFQVRGDIAKVFKVPPAKVRLIINYLGGGYGSKSYTKFEPLVVALARKAQAAGADLQFRRRVDGHGAPSRRARADQDRRQKRRHDHGARGGDLSRHRRLRR